MSHQLLNTQSDGERSLGKRTTVHPSTPTTLQAAIQEGITSEPLSDKLIFLKENDICHGFIAFSSWYNVRRMWQALQRAIPFAGIVDRD